MARRPRTALDGLKRVSAETVELFDRLANTSDNATNRSSEALVGVLGATTSLLITYGVAIAIPAVSFAVSAPIAACFGIAVGILSWRGRSRFRIERETTENRLRIENTIANNRLKAEEVLRRLKALPKDAPQGLRNALYMEYLALAAALRQQGDFGDAGAVSPLAPPLALPPPSEIPLALPAPSTRNDEMVPRKDSSSSKAKKVNRKK